MPCSYILCVCVCLFLLFFSFPLFRCRYLLWLVCPRRREAWLGSEEKQGGSGHWTQALGGLPAEGNVCAVNTQKLSMHWRVQTCCIFHLCLPSWARTLTWQDHPSHWQMWPFFQLLLLSSDLGEWEKEGCCILEKNQKRQWSVHVRLDVAVQMSPTFCSAGCLLSITLNWESITLCWRSGPASKPAGLLTGWRTPRDKTHSKTSEIHTHSLQSACNDLFNIVSAQSLSTLIFLILKRKEITSMF